MKISLFEGKVGIPSKLTNITRWFFIINYGVGPKAGSNCSK